LYRMTEPEPVGRVNSDASTPIRRRKHCSRSTTVLSLAGCALPPLWRSWVCWCTDRCCRHRGYSLVGAANLPVTSPRSDCLRTDCDHRAEMVTWRRHLPSCMTAKICAHGTLLRTKCPWCRSTQLQSAGQTPGCRKRRRSHPPESGPAARSARTRSRCTAGSCPRVVHRATDAGRGPSVATNLVQAQVAAATNMGRITGGSGRACRWTAQRPAATVAYMPQYCCTPLGRCR